MSEIEEPVVEQSGVGRRRFVLFPVILGLLLCVGWVRLASMQLSGGPQGASVVRSTSGSQRVATREPLPSADRKSSADPTFRQAGRAVTSLPRRAWRKVRSALRSMFSALKGV